MGIKKNIAKKIGMGEILKGSNRLNGYLKSINDEQKEIIEVLQNNLSLIYTVVTNIEKKIDLLLKDEKRKD